MQLGACPLGIEPGTGLCAPIPQNRVRDFRYNPLRKIYGCSEFGKRNGDIDASPVRVHLCAQY